MSIYKFTFCKLLKIKFWFNLDKELFFNSFSVCYAEPIDEAVDFSDHSPAKSNETETNNSGSSTHETSSGNTHGGHGATFGADEDSVEGNVGDDFCSKDEVKNVLRLLGYFLLLLRLFVPIIIIAKGTFLFYNAVVSDKNDAISKSAKQLGVKVAIGIAIFFIPTLISAALGLYKDFSKVESEYETCATCLLEPTEC